MDGIIDLARQPADRRLSITRLFDVPQALAFDVWTQREHLMRWWGPKGFVVTSVRLDLREGGAYHIRMRAPEGTEHGMSGVYREISRPDRLVFTFIWDEDSGEQVDTLVAVTFTAKGDRTEITFQQAPFSSVESRDSHVGGWGECLDRLEAHLAAQPNR